MSDASKLGWIGLVCLVAFSGQARGGSITYGATHLPYSYPYYQAPEESSTTPLRWRSYSVNGLGANRLSTYTPAAASPSLATTTGGLFASVPSTPRPAAPATTRTVSAPSVQLPARSAPAPAVAPAPVRVPSEPADAFLNFGAGPYPSASALGADSATPWYTSSVVTKLFGGTPSASQRSEFAAEVRDVVQKIYSDSGIPIDVTTDPGRDASHTMSLAANASYGPNQNAIGLTEIGRNGMTFVDKFGQAKDIEELASAVGHNMAHELMHAFGVADHPDNSGEYVDSGKTSWDLLTDPNATFSPDAKSMLLAIRDNAETTTPNALGAQMLKNVSHTSTCQCGAHTLNVAPAPVPEPTTVALWLAGGLGLFCHSRRRSLAARS